MINRYDNFTKLREIVLGSVNRSMLDVVDKKDKQFFADILDGQDLVFQQLQKILEQYGVKIHRPNLFDHSKLEHKLGIHHELFNLRTSLVLRSLRALKSSTRCFADDQRHDAWQLMVFRS